MAPRSRSAFLLLLVALGAPVAAGWAQEGGDAARTFRSEAGPMLDDVVCDVRLPGSRADWAPPLLVGDSALVAVRSNLRTDAFLDENATYEVDLTTCDVRRVLELSDAPVSWATDGALLYVFDRNGMDAYPIEGGAAVWSLPYPVFEAAQDAGLCPWPAVEGRVLYAACNVWNTRARLAVADYTTEFVVLAVDLDARSVQWMWRKSATDELLRAPLPPPADPPETTTYAGASPWTSLSVIGDKVVAVTMDLAAARPAPGGAPRAAEAVFWALDRTTGDLVWSANGTKDAFIVVPREGVGAPRSGVISQIPPTGNEATVFALFDDLVALSLGRGEPLWQAQVRREDQEGLDTQRSAALVGDALYVTTDQSLYRFDARRGAAPVWGYTLPADSDSAWGSAALHATSDVVYARGAVVRPFVTASEALFIQAFNATDGRTLWRHEVEYLANASSFPAVPLYVSGMGNGVLVLAGFDGHVVALGETDASPRVQPRLSDAYPAPGESLEVDLSASGGGSGGPPTLYRVVWGDGNVSDWSATPVLTHAYAEAGPRTARMQVMTAGNQTGSALALIDVGGTPPIEPRPLTPLQRAFSAEYQNLTLFFLGILVTVAGGVGGVVAVRRRRGLLRRELAAVESAFRRTLDRPEDCEAAMRGARARARTLLLEGKLEDGHYVVLERRIEELLRDLPRGGPRDVA